MYVCTLLIVILIQYIHSCLYSSASLARRAKEIVTYRQVNSQEVALTSSEILASMKDDLRRLLKAFPTTLDQDMDILARAGSGLSPFVHSDSGSLLVGATDKLPSGTVFREQLKASLFQRMERKKLLHAALAVLTSCVNNIPKAT